MLSYGFQRLALIGSAGYQRAELPLDDSVSLIAPNNQGKTSLINALQFLLIIDQRRMDFGSHTLEKARRFYFPNNSAYILLEVILPQTGTVVFGCVGKGVGHDYEYFAYKGELNLDDFRLNDGNIVTQPKLVNHLATKKHRVYKYNDKEFRHSIYGGTKSKKNSEIDFTVFKLEHVSDARSFQQVLTKTLRLDKLNSSDVKDYLLKIFSRELPNSSIDFKQEWEKAFQDINLEREQYLAAVNNLETIQELEQKFERTLSLRGKIAACQPKVNELLQDWHGHAQTLTDNLATQKTKLEQTQREFRSQDIAHAGERTDLTNKLEELNRTDKQQQELEQRFSLIPNQLFLESQLKTAEQEYDAQAALCIQSQRSSSAVIGKQLKEKEDQLQSLQSQHQTLGDNLYLHLSKVLNVDELEKLNKVLSQRVMQLPPSQYSFDINQLRHMLNCESSEQLSLSGLKLSIEELIPQHVQKTGQELVEEIGDVNKQITELKQLLEVSRESEAAERKKNELNLAVKQCEQDLRDYEQLQQLTNGQEQRNEQRQTFDSQLVAINTALENADKKHNELAQQIGDIADKLSQLSSDDSNVEKLKRQRIDDQALFSMLSEKPHIPWIVMDDWSLENLPVRLEQYIEDCKDLDKLSKELRQVKNDLAQKGLTKFQVAQTQDDELKGIIKFSHCLDDEKKALERRARSAVVNVTASLRELRSGLYALQSKMKEFNRLISHRQLSDLKTFKIEPVEESQLVDAMNVLIQQAEQTESGQSFELFDQASILDDAELERAKSLLIEEGNARQGLRVADLFRLEFVVAKQGQQQESFEDIDSAASNGTVLMAKLVTGLAMLHLMQDKRHQMKAICYLDEALALDTKNQANLIEIAEQFGFALIFASPAPLTTARYCVPIHQANGKNHISRNSWQIFEPIEIQELPKPQLEPSL
ncbi:Chromosome segregation ATPase [Vibrio crassostreae]|uniref:hypothetical protein n=1 Tax=Vibrio crassostreae TaxID=246167 RepID=UPI000F488243|nr:hypothetical protein [Vibrio crassostreae]ROR15992.1 hypothetical protein EDB36_104109 [Vibrio crassostreae]CAK2075028.1 Chromosome segregation ATPase [Vibrio crassostreae]CAK2344084.1 Chromosome segregation ATPase [Vibrio crassostreae]CAK2355700.1 Chromosome segregation ATPase [Vibrio crassostreae]CAK3412563.1 Chromosome segregation ATPase [Vibrio crassostreae]